MIDPLLSPWLTIVGIGEDGLAGLSEASRKALTAAETVFGGERHLALAGIGNRRPCLAGAVRCERRARLPRPVRRWCSLPAIHYGTGVGGSLAPHLRDGEWRAHPAPSIFTLVAARLGWRLENVICRGLHAAPFEALVPLLVRGARLICLVRDSTRRRSRQAG